MPGRSLRSRTEHSRDQGRLSMRTIVWFRDKDLRLSDHQPLWDAQRGGQVIPLWILDPETFSQSSLAEAPQRSQYLLDSLHDLAANIARRGSRLIVIPGRARDVLPGLVAAWGVDRVVAHRLTDPRVRGQDQALDVVLGGKLWLYEGETLLPPGSLRTSAGRPFSVFTRFARAFRRRGAIGVPLPSPEALPPLPEEVAFPVTTLPTFDELHLERSPCLLEGGEKAAHERLNRFLSAGLEQYVTARNRMDLPGTSRLSADLRFGTLSARQVWSAVHDSTGVPEGAAAFANELLWREFAHSTLRDFPFLLEHPFRPEFTSFPWIHDETHWQAWVSGNTGYPVVDAAARQLLTEGFVHNRARMVAASFLTKHLLMDYRLGEAHYLGHLVDGDLANNNAGWQWSAGCGCDGQPYFRVFNPVTQGEKFDPTGAYVRRWVPELAKVPAAYIHRPWEASAAVLGAAGVRLGETYPLPIVDHRFARERFLTVAGQHVRQQRLVKGDGGHRRP